jgi:transcriptional regulator with XRE-family HTH domain
VWVSASELPRFTDNFIRLLGLHGLSQHFTAQLLGVSEATLSAWMNGKSTPSLAKAIDIAELFGISTERLMGATFVELLGDELADRERFERVEARIKRGGSSLRSL